jgi:hypothetical protein
MAVVEIAHETAHTQAVSLVVGQAVGANAGGDIDQRKKIAALQAVAGPA